MRETDVLIVGLGPVGATAANLAGALGLRCVGADFSESVFALPRAIHFDAEIMRIFQSVGLAEEVLKIVRVGHGSVHLGADGEPIRDFRVSGEVGELGWSPHYMFYQPQLDQLLRDRARERPTVELELGWRCVGVDQDEEGVVGSFVNPKGEVQEVRASYLLACDGASSAVRGQLGISFFDYGFEEPWAVVDANVADDYTGPDHIVTHCDPARPIVYVPGPGRHRRWEYMILPHEDPQSLVETEAIRAIVGPASPWLDLDSAEIIRSAIYTFHGLVVRKWSEGKVFLCGDAAHQTPPFYAQGMCHGIRDVNGLMWKLGAVLGGRADSSLLGTYQAEREPHVRAIIEAAVDNGRYICILDRAEAKRRDEKFRARMRDRKDIGSFRGIIPGLVGGLLDDRGSPAGGVGEQIPQSTVITPAGVEGKLDDFLGDHFALLSVEAAAEVPENVDEGEMRFLKIASDDSGEEVADIIDPSGALNEWFRSHGATWAIVRPDRYVFGLAGGSSEAVQSVARLKEMLDGRSTPVVLADAPGD